jgi:hypothetical protein
MDLGLVDRRTISARSLSTSTFHNVGESYDGDTVLQRIPAQFACGGHDCGLTHKAELQVGSPDPDPLPDEDDIRRILDEEFLSLAHWRPRT